MIFSNVLFHFNFVSELVYQLIMYFCAEYFFDYNYQILNHLIKMPISNNLLILNFFGSSWSFLILIFNFQFQVKPLLLKIYFVFFNKEKIFSHQGLNLSNFYWFFEVESECHQKSAIKYCLHHHFQVLYW